MVLRPYCELAIESQHVATALGHGPDPVRGRLVLERLPRVIGAVFDGLDIPHSVLEDVSLGLFPGVFHRRQVRAPGYVVEGLETVAVPPHLDDVVGGAEIMARCPVFLEDELVAAEKPFLHYGI